MHSTTGQIGVVWVSHGNKLIRCHPTQHRRCSEREVSIASLKGLVQISMPMSVTEMTSAFSPGQYEDLSTNLPTQDDWRFGEVNLEEPPVGQETMAPSFVSMLPSGAVVDPVTKHSHSICHPDQTLFLTVFVVVLMYKLTNLLWHFVRCRFLNVT